jgi:hypothetical protein
MQADKRVTYTVTQSQTHQSKTIRLHGQQIRNVKDVKECEGIFLDVNLWICRDFPKDIMLEYVMDNRWISLLNRHGYKRISTVPLAQLARKRGPVL